MADKKSFILHTDLLQKTKRLSKEEKGELFEAILLYANGEEVTTEMSASTEIAWDFILPQLEADSKRYDDKVEKNRSNAKARWENKSKDSEYERNANECERMRTDANALNDNANDAHTDTDTDTDTDIKEKDSKESKKKRVSFYPPSVMEVQEYCIERGNNVNPESFINFYESKGWMVGRSRMKDWKACIRTWEQREPARKEKFDINSWTPKEVW